MNTRDLSTHVPYRAGRGIEEVARDLGLDPDSLVKLSSNENPLGPSPKAVEAIRSQADTVHTYPKSAHTDLGEALADEWDVQPEQVWLGAGGDGVLDYLARAMLETGQRVLTPDPGFAYYPMSARYHGGTVDTYRLEKTQDFEQSAEMVLSAYDDQRIIYLTSPHNPTGSVVTVDTVEAIASNTGEDTLVVVDEAYGEFADVDSARVLVDERDDVAILRTFSKAYGLAGLRLGYALVPEEWALAYDRVNTPFAVNALACHAGLAALGDDDHLETTIETVRWSREYLQAHLQGSTWSSGGNFVLCEVGAADQVADACQRQGVIVRDCSSFGLPSCIRVSCGTREQTRTAVETINEVVDA